MSATISSGTQAVDGPAARGRSCRCRRSTWREPTRRCRPALGNRLAIQERMLRRDISRQPARPMRRLGRAVRLAIANLGHAGRGQFDDGGPGPIGRLQAQRPRLPAGSISPTNGCNKAFAFGVVADQTIFLAQDEVDRADQSGRFGGSIEQGEDGRLVWVGGVSTAKAPWPSCPGLRRAIDRG